MGQVSSSTSIHDPVKVSFCYVLPSAQISCITSILCHVRQRMSDLSCEHHHARCLRIPIEHVLRTLLHLLSELELIEIAGGICKIRASRLVRRGNKRKEERCYGKLIAVTGGCVRICNRRNRVLVHMLSACRVRSKLIELLRM